jgi:hypothetical protein
MKCFFTQATILLDTDYTSTSRKLHYSYTKTAALHVGYNDSRTDRDRTLLLRTEFQNMHSLHTDTIHAINNKTDIESPVNSALRPLCFTPGLATEVCTQYITTVPSFLAAATRQIPSANPPAHLPYLSLASGAPELSSELQAKIVLHVGHRTPSRRLWCSSRKLP